MSETSLRDRLTSYSHASTARSFFHLIAAISGYSASVFILYQAYIAGHWFWYIPACISASLFMVKIFCLLHDCAHGSMFHQTWLNTWVGRFLSLFITMPFYAWKWEHEEHHSHVSDMEKMHHGDIPLLTVAQYTNASPLRRFLYRAFRQPIIFLLLSPFLYFFVKARVPSVWHGKVFWSVVMTNIVVAAIYIPLLFYFGFWVMVFVFAPAAYLGGMIGVTLFYLQHNYPDAQWYTSGEWKHEQAALAGSSLIVLPQPLDWLLHSIGYHHIHHLDSRIPGYHLKHCFDEVAEMQVVKPLTWRDVIAAFRLRLWSYELNALVTLQDATVLQR